jgi:hypothetical protein
MKIVLITAGAGGMYCGSCLRDNALASALMEAGHEVLLIPTYTPTRTDEKNVSHRRVFLGGINVYLQQYSRFFRQTPWVADRLLDFPPLLRFTTRWGVSVDPARLGSLTVSVLRGLRGFQSKEIRKLVQFLAGDARPEIITLPNSLLIALAPAIKSVMNVPVCCTLQGEDLFLDGLGEPYRSESLRLIREHIPHVDAFLAVSHFGARRMIQSYGIPAERTHVCPWGFASRISGLAPAQVRFRSPSDILPASRPRKGFTFFATHIAVCAPGRDCPPAGYGLPVTCPPNTNPISKGSGKTCRSGDSPGNFPTSANWTGRPNSPSSET